MKRKNGNSLMICFHVNVFIHSYVYECFLHRPGTCGDLKVILGTLEPELCTCVERAGNIFVDSVLFILSLF